MRIYCILIFVVVVEWRQEASPECPDVPLPTSEAADDRHGEVSLTPPPPPFPLNPHSITGNV